MGTIDILVIYVDRREVGTFGQGYLNELKEYQVKELPYGDFAIVVGDQAAIFERKRTAEFPGMLFSGRIFEQLKGLCTFDGDHYLIVEGWLGLPRELAKGRKGYVGDEQVMGLLVSAALSFGINIMPTGNQHQTALMLNIFHKKLMEKAKGKTKKVFATFRRLGKKPEDLALSSLASITGAGMADKMLRAQHNLATVIDNAAVNPEELSKIEGIGPKTVQKLKDVVEADYS